MKNSNLILWINISFILAVLSSCKKEPKLATITTLPITNNTYFSATSGGYISDDGGAEITARGIVWSSTNPNPSIGNQSTNNGTGIGNFTSNLTGLTTNTTYYVRSYAINSAGTVYGDQQIFNTTPIIVSNLGAGVTFNGYTYSSVILGNGQEWMAENLRTNSYANGDPIPNVTTPNQWANLTTGAWAHYNNDSQYESPFGKLYNWYVVADPRDVCPSGWHVPAESEWNTLINYLDPNVDEASSPNTAGGKMKTTTGWNDYDGQSGNGTNESGFSGLPGGYLSYNQEVFIKMDTLGHWWSSNEYNGFPMPCGINISLGYGYGSAMREVLDKRYGFSVRCIKD
jgi:uncharacterized protein (TIGR02145 family)